MVFTPGNPRHVFLLTDGEVFNVDQVFEEIYIHNKFTRVHAIGIGNGVSEDLILSVAKAGNGVYDFVKNSNAENLKKKALSMVHSAISPTLDEFKIRFSDQTAVKEMIPKIESIPFLIKNEPFRFYILLNKNFAEQGELELDFFY